MRGKTKRRAQRLRSYEIDLAKAGAVIRQAGYYPVGCDPVSARAWLNGSGEVVRIKATYADGWKATLGQRGLSWGIRLVTGKAE